MLHKTEDIQITSIDTRALSNLIIELNISRRNFNSYPKGHPVVLASFNKVLDAYSSLLDTTDEITIGVARDSLMVEGVTLEKSNLVYRDFAGVLFDHSIASLVLHPGLSREELSNFIIILALKREDVQRHGGIEQLWAKGRIASLSVKPVRYDLFSIREGDTSEELGAISADSLWEQFARALSQGDTIGGDGSEAYNVDPVVMAQALNSQFAGREASIQQSNYARSISDFMRQEDAQSALSANIDLPYQRLADFVSNLNPELRRQFLSSSLEACYSGGQKGAVKMVSHLPTDVILDTLTEVNSHRLKIPPVIMNLLNSLGRHADPLRQAVDDESMLDDELGQKMRSLFREHISEEFVPEQYQNKLNSIIANEQLPQMDRLGLEGVLGTLDVDRVEESISDIIMQLIMIDDESTEDGLSLVENLSVICSYFLETGDYDQLLKIMRQCRDTRVPESLREGLDSYFKSQEFLREILNGMHVWGKSRLDQIRSIIQGGGEVIIEFLLDALAEEESMSLRRFIMDRLAEFGQMARPPIIDRLSDNRWYVLRNLVVLLRLIGDASVVEAIRPMQRHANPRLRQEVQRTLLHFNDASIDQQILDDINSKNSEVRLAAIHQAWKSPSLEVYKKLVTIATQRGVFGTDYKLKTAAIKSLAEIGRPETLPELTKILASNNIFNPGIHTQYKLEIVRSLAQYPHQDVIPILKRLAGARDDVAKVAREILHKVGKQIS